MITKAFILGAGLGNRLQPLTQRLPKPLVPLFHRPLVEWALTACHEAGINEFAINTHHLPDAWNLFGDAADEPTKEIVSDDLRPAATRKWHGASVAMFHEPLLLETGGGLRNILPWIGEDDVLVHNGDIFSTLPLAELIRAHENSGMPVTLALRSEGIAKHIALDPTGTRVTDIRNHLGKGEGTHVFSGIYCVSSRFVAGIRRGEKISVIPYFLELAARGMLGAIVLDGGVWLDLGDRESYLQAHRDLALEPPVHPLAMVEAGAEMIDSVIGAGARIGRGAHVERSVIWPGAVVAEGASIQNCIVYSTQPVVGSHVAEDL